MAAITPLLDDDQIHLPMTVVHAHRIDWRATHDDFDVSSEQWSRCAAPPRLRARVGLALGWQPTHPSLLEDLENIQP